MATPTLTPEQAHALAREVYSNLYDATDSFDDPGIGAGLAYLLGGILTGQGMECFAPLGETEAPFDDLMRSTFAEGHPVWGFYCVITEEF